MQENNNHFDDKIKSSLDDFQVPYKAAHWNAMDSLLDAAHFDQIAKEKIQHIQAPLQMAAWERIASTIDVLAARKKVIYQSKLVELSLLLLLWSAMPFVAINDAKEEKENIKQEEIAAIQQSNIQILNHSKNQILNHSNSQPSNTQILKYPNTQQINNNNNNTSNLPWHEQPTTTITSFENTETVKTTIAEIVKEQANYPSMQRAPMIAVLSPKLLSEAVEQHIPLFVMMKAAKMSRVKKHIRLGVYVASDKQKIVTSDAHIFGDNYDLVQKKNTYSGGISLGIKRNKVEVETGLEYSRLQYASKTYFTQTAAYIRQSLTPIRLELIRVPVTIRYDFHQADRLTTYIAAGVALNLATRANYDHSEYGQTTFGRQSANGANEETPNYPDGLLNSGSFLNNHYLNGSVSIGLEYAFSPQYHCFIQPMYSWDIRQRGIGVTQDKIETVSVRLGMKKSF